MRICFVCALLAFLPCLMAATITVTSLADDTTTNGQVTLREAIQAAETDSSVDGSTAGSGADTIVFQTGLNGTITLATIGSTTLGNSAFQISTSISITGPLADSIVLQRDTGVTNLRAFRVTGTGNFTLNNLTLTGFTSRGGNGGQSSLGGTGGGGAGLGGAIYVDANGVLTVTGCTFTSNLAQGGNGPGSSSGGNAGGNGGLACGTGTAPSGGTNNGGDGTAGGFGQGGGGGGSASPSVGPGGDGADGGFGGGGGGGGGGNAGGSGTQPAGTGGTGGTFGGNGVAGSAGAPFTGGGGWGGGGAGLGGAIFANSATVVILNSTFSGNTATGGSGSGGSQAGQGRGGAIFFYNSSGTIRNSTIYVNTRGGVHAHGIGNARTINIESTIIANTAGGVNDYIQTGTGMTSTGGSNLIRTHTGFGGAISSTADPDLGTLASNGGPTQTHLPTYASPALDNGSNPGALTTDQRGTGFPRTVSVGTDIGAVELPLQPVLTVAPTAVNLGTTIEMVAGTTVGSFDVGGVNLQSDIVITPPAGVEIRQTSGTFAATAIILTPSGGTVSTTTIEARIASTATGGQAFADITVTTTGDSEIVTVTGTVLSPMLAVTPNSVDIGTVFAGTPGSTVDTFDVSGANLASDITITPSAGIEIRTTGAFQTTPLVLTQTGGSVAATTIEVRGSASATIGQSFNDIAVDSGSANDAVSVTGTVVVQPVISVTGGPLDFGSIDQGTLSAEMSFDVSGADLVADITLTPPPGIGLSDTLGGPYATSLTLVQTGGSVSTTTVYVVVLDTVSAGAIASDVVVASTGAVDETVAVTATVVGSGGGGGGGGDDDEDCTTGTGRSLTWILFLVVIAGIGLRRRFVF